MEQAFQTLIEKFTSAPILRHFDPELPIILEANASDFALSAVISQRSQEGTLHPFAFYNRKFTPVEINYEIYDKEMLAIVETMDRYRHYFKGLGNQTTVYSDYCNLLWFIEIKTYNR
jgi:RNase H-like domain found in reverse transcriptase